MYCKRLLVCGGALTQRRPGRDWCVPSSGGAGAGGRVLVAHAKGGSRGYARSQVSRNVKDNNKGQNIRGCGVGRVHHSDTIINNHPTT